MSFGSWIKKQAENAADTAGDVAGSVANAAQNPAGTVANAATNIPVVGQYVEPVAGALNNPIVEFLMNPVGKAVNTVGGGVVNNVGPYAAQPVLNQVQQAIDQRSIRPVLPTAYVPAAFSATTQALRGGAGLANDALMATPGYLASWVPQMGMASQQFARNPSLNTFFGLAATAADPYLRIANTPIEKVHEYQGAGAYYLAVNGGKMRGSDSAMPFNFAVEWAQAHPEEWNQIIRVHDDGYDNNGDGVIDFKGDRAVWEYFIGKQNTWVKTAAEVINDPWNVTLLLGGVEALAGKGAIAAGMEGNLALQTAFSRVARAAGWSDEAISMVLDAPFRGLGKIVKPVARIPGIRYLLEESPTSAVGNEAARVENVVGSVPRIGESRPLAPWVKPQNPTGGFDVITVPEGSFVVDPEGNPIPGYDFEGRGSRQRADEAAQRLRERESTGDTPPTGVATTPFAEEPPITAVNGITPFEFQQTGAERATALQNGDLSVFAPRLGDQRIVTIAQQAAVDHPEESGTFFNLLGLDQASGRPIIGGPLHDIEAMHARVEGMTFDNAQGGLNRKVIEQKLVYADGTINNVVPAYRQAFGSVPDLTPSGRTDGNVATFVAMTGVADNQGVQATGYAGLLDLALYDAGKEGDKAVNALNGMSRRQAKWLREPSPISGEPLINEINVLRKKMKNPDAMVQRTFTAAPELDVPGVELPPPSRIASPVQEIADPVDTWLANGVIDQPTADYLRTTPPGLDAPLIDTIAILERQGLSERQIRHEIASKIRGSIDKLPKEGRKGAISRTDKLIRFVRNESKANRQRMQFGMLNGVSGGLGDLFGNLMHFWQSGDIEGALRMWGNVDKALGGGDEAVGDYFTRQHNDFLKGLDLDFVAPDSVKFGQGDSGLVDLNRIAGTRLDRPGVKRALNVIESEWIMDRRHGLDALARNTTREQAMRDVYPEKLLEFTKYADSKGYDLEELMPDLRQRKEARGVKGPWFSAADVKASTGDEVLTKKWRELVGQAKAAGDAEAETRFFENATRTRLDEAISKVAYFHFWQSRAMALQARNMIRQPRVLGGYYRMMQGAINQAEQENYPDWAKGMLGYYGGPGGFYGLTGALQFLVPGAMFLDLANLRDDQSTIQKIMSVLPINPFINAAAAVVGASDNVPNLLGTGRMQTLIKNVANFMAAKGLIDQTPAVDHVQWATRAVLGFLNTYASKIPGIDEWQPYDPKQGSIDTIASVIYNNAIEQYGPAEEWTPQIVSDVNDAIAAIETGGKGNELADQAFDQWADATVINIAPQLLTPGGSTLRYGPRDQAMALNAEGSEAKAAGEPMTPEQQAASDQRDFVTASPDMRNLQTEERKIEALGTARQKAFYQGYNAIIYPSETANGNDFVTVMGMDVTVDMLRTLSESERRNIADEWVREQGGEQELAAFFDMRSAAKAQSSILTTREQYRDLIDQFASPRMFREWAAKEYPVFGRAMADYEQYLRDTKGVSGEVLQNELDAWVNFDASFLAFTGKNDSRYDTAPAGAGYEFAPPTLGAGSGTGGGSLADRINTDLTQYGRTMDDLKAQGLSDYMINWLRQNASSTGLTPELSDETKQFLAWRDRQPQGSDVSVSAYQKWLAGVAPSTQNAAVALR